MKIGMIMQAVPYLPATDGYRVYTANILRRLSRRHTIDLIAVGDGVNREPLEWAREHCASVTLVEPETRNAFTRAISLLGMGFGISARGRGPVRALFDRLTTPLPWDVIHVEGSYVAGTLPFGLPGPAILSLHDSGLLRGRALIRCAASWRDWAFYRALELFQARYERLVYRRFDRCVVVSEADRCAVCATCPECNVSTINIGIDTEYYRSTDLLKRPASMVFHGNLSYPPNIEAAEELARKILPLVRRDAPNAVLHLAGAAAGREVYALAAEPGVELQRDLPDIRTVLDHSVVYACPLRNGTGVKNKVLEAMAMGLPVVCYRAALEGLEPECAERAIAAYEPSDFAAIVVSLLRNPEAAWRMGAAARESVVANYDWELRAQAFERLYQEAIRDWRRALPFAQDALFRSGAGGLL